MIKVEGLVKKYDSFQLDCTMEVQKGRVTGLIGQNGAGKSTTFKAILGLIFPDAGKITICGKDVKDFTEKDRQRIGVVLSNSGFCETLVINDVIAICAAMYKNFDKDFFLQQCTQFGLPMNKKIKEFSTGMKAKLKVLVAISHKAELLILDEPTAGLDVVAREELLDILRQFMESSDNCSILISSHISSDLESLCDDFYLIHQGKIALHEDTDVLLSNYAVLKLDEKQYTSIDRSYLLRTKKENYGYKCLTNQRAFYQENYKDAVIEKGTLDELILMMIKGEEE